MKKIEKKTQTKTHTHYFNSGNNFTYFIFINLILYFYKNEVLSFFSRKNI